MSDASLDDLYLRIKDWVLEDIEHSAEWRREAKDAFSFVAGPGQWSEEDRAKLKSEFRPAVTFNKTLKFIKAVCGLEVNNRQMTTFLPRDVHNAGEVKANEILTNASDWMDQGCKAGTQQSRAFRDAAICGMGWTEQGLDYDEDPKGRYVETRCNPLEMGWDRNARDNNLSDSKRRWRIRKMSVAEARALIPGVTDEKGITDADLDASWASDVTDLRESDTPRTQAQKEMREENITPSETREEVHVVQIQWFDLEPYVRTADPRTGQSADLSVEDYERANGEYQGLTGQQLPKAMLKRKVYKQAFVGAKVLASGPAPRGNGFTFNCITGEPDDNEGVWFGLTRVLRDVQEWDNKFFSQLMHIINSTAKGGIIAEEDVFTDVREAQQTYARPQSITVVSKGAITKGKVMAKPGQGVTAGVMNLLQITSSMYQDTLGMNMELMGLADRQQPGVLEAQRKQAAMTILASLFDSLASFRQDVGKGRLWFIQNYLADGRLIRVHGDDGQKAIPLIQDQTLGDYDVIIDDAPSSPNMKEKAWSALQLLLPAVQHMMTPQVVVQLLDYVPGLPSRLVEALKSMAQDVDPAKQQMVQRKEQAEIAETEASAANKKSGAILNLARAGREKAQTEAAQFQSEIERLMQPKPLPMVQDDPVTASPQSLRPIRELEEAGIVEPSPLGNAAATPPGVQLPGGLMSGMN